MIWFIIISFYTFDGWTHKIPVYNEPPYVTMESCKAEAKILQDKLIDQWPDKKANLKEIVVDCYTMRPEGN